MLCDTDDEGVTLHLQQPCAGFSTPALTHARLNLMSHIPMQAVHHDADDEGVTLHFQQGDSVRGSALVICDGYWSRLRQQCLSDGPPNLRGQSCEPCCRPLMAHFCSCWCRHCLALSHCADCELPRAWLPVGQHFKP